MTALRLTRRVRTSSLTASLLLLIIGLGLLFFFWPLGVVLILVALLSDKAELQTTCGNCGNQVAPTSILCPTCQVQLTAEPIGRQFSRSLLRIGALIAIILIGIVLMLVVGSR